MTHWTLFHRKAGGNRRRNRRAHSRTQKPAQLPFPHSKELYKLSVIWFGFLEASMLFFFDFFARLFGRTAAPEAQPEVPSFILPEA